MHRRPIFMLAAVLVAVVLALLFTATPRLIGTNTALAPVTGSETIEATAQPVDYPVSADQAGTLAISNVPGASLAGTPMIVTYQGSAAYEVPLSNGRAFVDATSGQVLAAFATSGATIDLTSATAQSAPAGQSDS